MPIRDDDGVTAPTTESEAFGRRLARWLAGAYISRVEAGVALITLGVMVLAVRFTWDIDCTYEVMCQGDGGLSPTLTDRLAYMVGLSSEQPHGEGVSAVHRLVGVASIAATVVGAAPMVRSASKS